MNTGSHVLGAFNIDFDSFVDNVVFCALIDRVGKYQLAMQKISAYQPMAESMPQMLREEAFHLAAGVVPMRRWVDAGGARARCSSPWTCSRRRSTSGCRAAWRCSATSAAAAPTCATASSR